MASSSETGPEEEPEPCSQCGDKIDGQPLYPSRDIMMGDGGLEYVEEPDGPFCDSDCLEDYDGK